MQTSRREGVGLVVSIALLVLALLLWWQRQAVTDWWRLQSYSPTVEVTTLAKEDTMTDRATRIFYVNHPRVLTSAAGFHSECPQSEKTIVLGCYHSSQAGIGIYKVQDQRLNGVEEVTAAHEMLHAAYDRLSSSEKTWINAELQSFFQNSVHDQRIIETINSYKQTEPGQVVNEMHSIMGSEVNNLTPSLEAYYKRYFTNRSAITAFADKYEAEFKNRIDKINSYDQQLESLKQDIDSEENSLDSQLTQLQTDRQRLDSLRSSGQIAEYNAAVPGFNAEVNQYNDAVSKLKADIAEYNNLVSTRNSIASELRGLSNSIDTRLTTQSSR